MTTQIHAILDKDNHNTAKEVTWSWPQSRDRAVIVAITDIFDIFQTKFELIDKLKWNPPQSNLTRIRPMQDAVICADRRTDSYDEDNRLLHFVRMCLKALYSSKCIILRDMPLAAFILQSSFIIRSLRYPCWPHKYQQSLTAKYMHICAAVCYVAHATERWDICYRLVCKLLP